MTDILLLLNGHFLCVLSNSIGYYVDRSVRQSVRWSVGNQFAFYTFSLNIARLIKVKILKYFRKYSRKFEDFLSS